MSLTLSFLKIALAICGLLWLHTNFRIVCSIPMKNAIGTLVGIASNMCIVLESMDILTVLILPVYEHRLSFHLFVSSIYFINILSLSLCMLFTSLVKFIPRYFIIFDATINQIAYLIFLFDSFLLV